MTTEETTSKGNPNWKPKFLSEFSMGDKDFERYNELIKEIDRWSSEIDITAEPQLFQIQRLFTALKTLHRNWKPIIASKNINISIEDKVKEAKKIKRTLEQKEKLGLPYNKPLYLKVSDILEEVAEELMEIKQKIGLGTVVRKNLTTREKIKAGVRGSLKASKFHDLPEA